MKLSIITVNFNNLEGLKKTYESVASQTFRDYEWLVIDGGSTDGSREFIEQHQDKFAYWCSEPDKGIYNAMNKGIVKAKGEYLNFMNSGDCFVGEDVVKRVFSEQYITDIIYGIQLSQDGNHIIPINIHTKLNWYELFCKTIPHQASFIKRELFQSFGMYDENYKVISDYKWFIEAVIYHGASYSFYPKAVSFVDGGGISSTNLLTAERHKLVKEIFPKNMTDEDMGIIMKLHFIRTQKWAYFLFKVLGIIAYRIDTFKNKHFSKQSKCRIHDK